MSKMEGKEEEGSEEGEGKEEDRGKGGIWRERGKREGKEEDGERGKMDGKDEEGGK